MEFLSRIATSPIPIPSQKQSLEHCAGYTGKQRGKRRKSCSGLSISTGRTSWKFNWADGQLNMGNPARRMKQPSYAETRHNRLYQNRRERQMFYCKQGVGILRHDTVS